MTLHAKKVIILINNYTKLSRSVNNDLII